MHGIAVADRPAQPTTGPGRASLPARQRFAVLLLAAVEQRHATVGLSRIAEQAQQAGSTDDQYGNPHETVSNHRYDSSPANSGCFFPAGTDLPAERFEPLGDGREKDAKVREKDREGPHSYGQPQGLSAVPSAVTRCR